MKNFEEFINEVKRSSSELSQLSGINLSEIQIELKSAIAGAIAPLCLDDREKQKFSKEVSSLVENESFISEFSDKIGEPLENESEEEFVKRSSLQLKQMLYSNFNIQG
jgi:hypothetical protein